MAYSHRTAAGDLPMPDLVGKRGNPDVNEAVGGRVTSRNADAAIIESWEGFRMVLPVVDDVEPIGHVGEHVLVYVTSVDGGLITVSRSHPMLPARLLEGVVPELTDGTVRIMRSARIAGRRTKIAVAATTEGVSAVSACVGRGGRRVSLVVDRLGGERVDIVPWHSDASEMLASALAPGRCERVEVDADQHVADVFCQPHLMPATVGENGSNAYLAGQLTGLRVNVVALG